MTPAKRRRVTPASQGPTRTAPDVPKVAPPDAPVRDVPSSPPDAPVADALVTTPVRRATKTPPTKAEKGAPEDGATTPSPRRPLSLYPLPVWPD
jgi:hypothetical protein